MGQGLLQGRHCLRPGLDQDFNSRFLDFPRVILAEADDQGQGRRAHPAQALHHGDADFGAEGVGLPTQETNTEHEQQAKGKSLPTPPCGRSLAGVQDDLVGHLGGPPRSRRWPMHLVRRLR